MVDDLTYYPAYVSPLTDKDHATIGRIVVLWGQIEYLVDCLLPRVSDLKWSELKALQVDNKNTSSKVGLLKELRNRLPDAEKQDQVFEFCMMIDNTKVRRNHLMHGIWGWRGNSREKSIRAASRKRSAPGQPLYRRDLTKFEKELCACSRLGQDLVYLFDKYPYRPMYSRFFHHDDSVNAHPTWMKNWTAENPNDSEEFRRNHEIGQLPRLNRHYPEK